MTPLVLDEIDQPEVWELVAWTTERSTDWVLIGGLMVASFDVEYGLAWRPTEDIDSLFDVRHAPRGAIRSQIAELREAGFEFVLGREALGHRLRRGDLILDVLATEHFPADPLVGEPSGPSCQAPCRPPIAAPSRAATMRLTFSLASLATFDEVCCRATAHRDRRDFWVLVEPGAGDGEALDCLLGALRCRHDVHATAAAKRANRSPGSG